MVRRLLLFLLLVACCGTPSMAVRTICDQNGENCHEYNPLPDLSNGIYHPPSPGSGSFVFTMANAEPFRNSDTGPLGVVLSNGEFQFTVTDLEIPGRGFPFRLSRTYRSRKDYELSVLGYNWHLSYDEYLTPGYFSGFPSVMWTMGNGWTDVYVFSDSSIPVGFRSGVFARVLNLGQVGGVDQGYQLRSADGTVKSFRQRAQLSNGTIVWLLTKIEDRNGNMLTLHYPANARGFDYIVDTLGRKISFTYDQTTGRLQSVTYLSLRTVTYSINQAGDLASVTSPPVAATSGGIDLPFPSGKTTTYHYLGEDGCTEIGLSHNMKSIIRARANVSDPEVPFLTNGYNATTDACGILNRGPAGSVASQTYGSYGEAQSMLYTYEFVGSTITGPNEVNTRTTVRDQNGNTQVHEFNSQGNPLRVVHQTNRGIRQLGGADEPDYVETNTYVDYGNGDWPMLVARHTEAGGKNIDSSGNLDIYGGGMSVEYTYYDQWNGAASPDLFQKGNVLEVKRMEGSRGGSQADLITKYRYEPLFNQPVKIKDPKGHVSRAFYDYQEGDCADLRDPAKGPVLDTTDPLWWPNNNVCNWMGTAGNSGLSEINGDGYHRGGNAIKVWEGDVRNCRGQLSPEIAAYTKYNSFGLPTARRDAENNETQFEYYKEEDPDGDGVTTTPNPPPDGRTLSSDEGAAGGGYLSKTILKPDPTDMTKNIELLVKYDKVGNVTRRRDGRGIWTDYSVNELDQITRIVHAAEAPAGGALTALQYTDEFKYDANNNLVRHRSEQRDDVGQAIGQNRWINQYFSFDVLNRRVAETVTTADSSPITLTTRSVYDPNGNIIKTISPGGNVMLRFYDERNLLHKEAAIKHCTESTAVCNPDYEHCTEPASPVCNSIDPAQDPVTQYDYDGSGNVIQVTDPEGHVTRTGYDGYNRKVIAFDPGLQRTEFAYDSGGNLTAQDTYGGLDGSTTLATTPPAPPYSELSRQRMFYDELGRLRRSDRKFFKYDETTQVLLPTNHAGLGGDAADGVPTAGDGWAISLIDYDRQGRAVKATDDNGHYTETRYDGLGRKLQVLSNPSTIAGSQVQNKIALTYDKNGNVVQTDRVEYGNDRTGGGSQQIGALTYRTTLEYDAMNRMISANYVGRIGAPSSLNYTTRVAYDSRGNKIQVIDPNGKVSKASYDGIGRIVSSTRGYAWNGTAATPALDTTANADGLITTSYLYDFNSRLTQLTDDNGRVTAFAYDNLNRPKRITYPDGVYKDLNYDLDSRVSSAVEAKPGGSTLVLTPYYDVLHRMIQRDINRSAAWEFGGTKRQVFEYDGLGRLTRAVDDGEPTEQPQILDSQVKFTYDSLGDVLSETQATDLTPAGYSTYDPYVVTSEYNAVGFRTRVTYPGGRTVSFQPDALNRLESLLDSFTGTTSYDYLGSSRVLNRRSPNNTRLTMLIGSSDQIAAGYDDAGRIKELTHETMETTPTLLTGFTYGYDALGNRLYERREHERSNPNEPENPNRRGEWYWYDAANRVLNRLEGDLNLAGDYPVPAPAPGYRLDGLGNWASYVKNGTSYANVTNTLNQYTTFRGTGGNRTLTYDFAGNLMMERWKPATQWNTQTYSYDFANRLLSYVDQVGNATEYRYDALNRRVMKNWQGTTFRRFVYDKDQLIQERDYNNEVMASYLYGAGKQEVLSRRWCQTPTSCNDQYYHSNALGSIVAVTGSDGTVLERYKYDAYGKPTFLSADFQEHAPSTIQNNILFSGAYYDGESGNYYLWHREYDPYLGRFLQRDPLGEGASLNLYAYVFDNPVNATDPTGLTAEDDRAAQMQQLEFRSSLQSRNQAFAAGKWRNEYRGSPYVNYQSAQFRNFEDAVGTSRLTALGTIDQWRWNRPKSGSGPSNSMVLAEGSSGFVDPCDLAPDEVGCASAPISPEEAEPEWMARAKGSSDLSNVDAYILYGRPDIVRSDQDGGVRNDSSRPKLDKVSRGFWEIAHEIELNFELAFVGSVGLSAGTYVGGSGVVLATAGTTSACATGVGCVIGAPITIGVGAALFGAGIVAGVYGLDVWSDQFRYYTGIGPDIVPSANLPNLILDQSTHRP